MQVTCHALSWGAQATCFAYRDGVWVKTFGKVLACSHSSPHGVGKPEVVGLETEAGPCVCRL